MGKQVVVKDGLTNVWLYSNGVFNGGDTVTMTDAEYAALGSKNAVLLTDDDPVDVAEPDRAVQSPDWGTLADAINAHVNDATDAHDASAISFAAGGSFVATDLQAAVEEAHDDAVAESEAYADDLNDAMDARVTALEP